MPAAHRARLGQLCRYLLRPPVAQERLRLTADGLVLVELKSRWADGTRHLLFEPLELLEKLAALTPRPRINLLLYHGVLAPHSRWRDRAVAYEGADPIPTPAGDTAPNQSALGAPLSPPTGKPRYWAWAALMRRAFDLDVLTCPRCGGRMRLLATIEDPRVIRQILAHLGLPTAVPQPRPPPARAADFFSDSHARPLPCWNAALYAALCRRAGAATPLSCGPGCPPVVSVPLDRLFIRAVAWAMLLREGQDGSRPRVCCPGRARLRRAFMSATLASDYCFPFVINGI